MLCIFEAPFSTREFSFKKLIVLCIYFIIILIYIYIILCNFREPMSRFLCGQGRLSSLINSNYIAQKYKNMIVILLSYSNTLTRQKASKSHLLQKSSRSLAIFYHSCCIFTRQTPLSMAGS